MERLKIVEKIPSVEILEDLEKSYVLTEDETLKLQYDYYDDIAGDIVYRNAENKYLHVSPANWDESLGTPLGVCVIPPCHEVYGDDKTCAIISLDVTSTTWRAVEEDVPSLVDVKYVPTNHSVNQPQGYLPEMTVPSDSQKQNFDDKDTYWSTVNSANIKKMPSLYLFNGSRNKKLDKGASFDFNGIENTTKIIEAVGDNDGKKYAAQIAASKTDGGLTWYLPALGELIYVLPRLRKINEGISKLNGTPIAFNNQLWSSTKYDDKSAWSIQLIMGLVIPQVFTYPNFCVVRAFSKIKLDN